MDLKERNEATIITNSNSATTSHFSEQTSENKENVNIDLISKNSSINSKKKMICTYNGCFKKFSALNNFKVSLYYFKPSFRFIFARILEKNLTNALMKDVESLSLTWVTLNITRK